MCGKTTTYLKLKSLVVITSLLFCVISCASPSRYRVLIANKTKQPLECAGYFYNNSNQIEGRGFDDLFEAGKKANLLDGEWINIEWPTIQDYKYFWVGIKNNKGEHWVLNGEFEEYGRYWFDISEGLRIDYIIGPNGEIKKSYWE